MLLILLVLVLVLALVLVLLLVLVLRRCWCCWRSAAVARTDGCDGRVTCQLDRERRLGMDAASGRRA